MSHQPTFLHDETSAEQATRAAERVNFLAHDRETTSSIKSLADLIHSGELLEAVRDALGGGFD